ncbi:MAG: helix-turn-helix domain-containing protein [Reyranella sp.]|nr:helix-turn-helix domain-containing protein [Reyranella sp.]
MPTKDAFAIGALSEETGVNIETIRYYERIGLLRKAARSAAGYRLYRAGDVARLCFVRRARDLGFSLEDVRRLLALADRESRSCEGAKEIAEAHLEEVRAKLVDLRQMERVLAATVKACGRGAVPDCPLLGSLGRLT